MIVAHIDGQPTFATKGARGTCPDCNDIVLAKVGEILRPHWAHRPESVCDHANNGETPWHAAWKLTATNAARVEYAEGQHRADLISPGGYVVEFQHSSIDPAAIRNRERHWRRGCWVYDGTTDDGQRLKIRRHPDRMDDDYRVIDWERPRLLITTATWPIWVDLGPDRPDHLLKIEETRPGQWVTGSGRLVPRQTFVDGIVNGWGLTPATPPPGAPWRPEPVTTAPECLFVRCHATAQYKLSTGYSHADWHGCHDHWAAMRDALGIGLPGGDSVTATKVAWL